ncbi:MAG TPA: hypothetical protein VFJ02_10640 [Vicinamibacterales bacterium]|nr:hypothetical protein [Vicinamibacterales bacterium]
MLSPGVLQILDQVRSEFGVEVEIIDANLTEAWTPEGERLSRVLARPEVRSAGVGALREGRSSVVTIDEREYRLVPLRSHRSVLPTALLAMRVATRHGEAEGPDVEPWVEVLRGAIEADLSSREDIDHERQQARAVRGALKFVTYLAAARSEREVAEAALQAAAIWFDADARVYRRRPGGDFVLAAALPGAAVPADARTVSELALGLSTPFVRIAPLAGVANGREAVVVPMSSSAHADWVLVVIGTVPQEADVTLEALGRVLGVQMERLTLVRLAEARARFETLLVRPERSDVAARPSELTAIDLLRELVSRTAAESAALWIRQGDAVRRMAAVGTAAGPTERVPSEARDTGATLQMRSIDLGAGRTATLELRTGADAVFDPDAPAVIDACVSVLTSWLPAAARPEPQGSTLLLPSTVAGFVRRIEEELARAKRFDRDLSLVVVDAGGRPWPQETTDRLVDVLRAELRGSDVLGLVGDRRVVVLLIETHQSAVGTVVRRLRDRLGRVIPELKVPALVLGQAAYSHECATADALLSQAAVNAETITVPA